ncbi:MAG: polyribonucleotide nucleotidyltransferase [Candidatus Goldbacteria bacterium]|nr:polyribonucleotide nucleotidyltransferase [Candidatus Goldiibacteriota bacterium]
MANYITREVEIAGKKISFETGRMAKQAGGAVVVRTGDTMVLVTAVAAKDPKPNADFFPLTVEYREKFYAAGKIPGGFFKREGKPREKEILSSRIIDRPIRPLFPEGFFYEVQIIATVISADKQNDSDLLGLIGASAALDISDIPFDGPVSAVRVGRIDGKFVVNPTMDEQLESDLNITVAGTIDAITMVEGETNVVSEADLVQALGIAHENIKKLCQFMTEFKKECGKPKREVVLKVIPADFKAKVEGLAKSKMQEAMKIADKIKRYDSIADAKKAALEAITAETPEKELGEKISEAKMVLEEIEAGIIRNQIANDSIRPDGRKFDEIREITCEIDILPRTHGSAIFTRGQTQALVVTTLGAEDDAQRLDELEGDFTKSYMLQYNFPPFSVGEARMLRGVGRREVGHGNLAERALKAVMPSKEDFPYTVQVVSDILESNGSSSMATVCGGSLSLMAAGVPIKKHVAGIAMGLIKQGDKFIVLTDIQGAEDHFGDMDFKVAGTEDGVTAIQMDIKIKGVTLEILTQALEQAKKARLFLIKEKMEKAINVHKAEMSPFAPKIGTININKERIKDLIGPGGKNIKRIVEETGAKIDVEQDGKVRIFAQDEEIMQHTMSMIKELTQEAEVGAIYNGTVIKIMNFGAFIEILPGVEGLCHVSNISKDRVANVTDVLTEGQKVVVLVKDVDSKTGKIALSMKDVEQPAK